MSLIIGSEDETCLPVHGYELANEIKSICNVVTVEGGHDFPLYAEFADIISDELTNDCVGYSYPVE